MQTGCLVRADHPRSLWDVRQSQALRGPAPLQVTGTSPQLHAEEPGGGRLMEDRDLPLACAKADPGRTRACNPTNSAAPRGRGQMLLIKQGMPYPLDHRVLHARRSECMWALAWATNGWPTGASAGSGARTLYPGLHGREVLRKGPPAPEQVRVGGLPCGQTLCQPEAHAATLAGVEPASPLRCVAFGHGWRNANRVCLIHWTTGSGASGRDLEQNRLLPVRLCVRAPCRLEALGVGYFFRTYLT